MSNAPQHRLVYIRHGETQWSRTGRHTGSTDVPLTETGEEQARALAPVIAALRLQSPTVWVSPRTRAARTAELAGLTVTGVEPELAEWDYGDYEGLTSVEIRQDVAGWTVWDAAIPGGESIDAVAARADDVIAKARAAMAEGDVVLVAHGHIGRVLAARFLDADPRFGRHLPVLPASASIFGYDHDGVPQLHQFGRTGYDAVGYGGR